MAANRKPRSPRYPQVPLEEAIERVGRVYREERTHKVPKEAVAKDLGYGSLNGGSISLIGTLKNYGLLYEDKQGVKVTEDAVTLLRAPEDDPEREEALRRVAFTPKVFAELYEAYGDDPSELPGEAALRYRLEKRGFLEKAAGEVIRIYHDNLELVSGTDTEYAEAEMVDELPVEAQVQTQQPARVPPGGGVITSSRPATTIEQDPFTETLQYRISGDSRVRLLFDGAVTQEAIEKLIAYLELGKDDFPPRAELEQPAVEQPVKQPEIVEMPEAE
jgi:hypothetical protein